MYCKQQFEYILNIYRQRPLSDFPTYPSEYISDVYHIVCPTWKFPNNIVARYSLYTIINYNKDLMQSEKERTPLAYYQKTITMR